MGSTRKINRKNNRLEVKKQEISNNKKSLRNNILSAVMALGVAAYPISALAADIQQNITKANASNPMTAINGLTQIYADSINGNIAVNNFKKFDLAANNIANMYFNQENKNIYADNLVNLVGEKINIAGTVNAVKNGKIGGNLFFLSTQGMAVTKTGVINTGSLTILTPTANTMASLTGVNAPDNIATMINKPNNIALNSAGTITIDGKINAAGNVAMYTGKEISVGSSAAIKTHIKNFSSLVNINGNPTISAGLSSNLTATTSDNGDVVLSVASNTVNAVDSSFKPNLSLLINADENSINANIVQDGTIEAAGKVELLAKATNGKERDAQTVATINVDGKINATTINIDASSENKFIVESGAADKAKDVSLSVLGIDKLDIKAEHTYLKSNSQVNINKNAQLNATGTNKTQTNDKGEAQTIAPLTISANSTINTKIGEDNALVYAYTNTNSSVNIAGQLTSKADVNITGKSNLKIESSAKTSPSQAKEGEKADMVNAAVLIVDAKNTSAVNIQNTANISKNSIAGDLNIASKTESDISSEVETAASKDAIFSTALNINLFNSSANTDIATNLNANGNINISAENTIEGNTVTTSNATEEEKKTFTSGKGFTDTKTFNAIMDKKPGSNSVLDKVLTKFGNLGAVGEKISEKIDSTLDSKAIREKLGDSVGVGTAIQYVNQSNTANVNVHKVAINSGKKVDINSKTDVKDTLMTVASGVTNQKTDGDKTVVASGALLVSSIDNSSNTTIEGGTSNAHTTITGEAVSITATTLMPYNRVDKMIEEVKEAAENVKKFYKTNPFAQNEKYKNAINKIDTALSKIPDLGKADSLADSLETIGTSLDNFAEGSSELASLIASDTSTVKDAILKPLEVLKKAKKFISPDQYVNFYVRTEFDHKEAEKASTGAGTIGGTSTGQDAGSKLSAAGSININSVTNNSKVILGKNTSIQSADITAQSDTTASLVSFTGNGSEYLKPNSATKAGVGASLAVQQFSSNSLTLVAEGVNLSAPSDSEDNKVSITAKNKLTPTGVVFSSGQSEEKGLSGMINVMTGDSNALAVVDNEATIGNAKTSVNIEATNTSTLTNVAGGFMKTQGTAVGIAASVNLYDVNTVAGVIDNDNITVNKTQIDENAVGKSAVLTKTDNKIKDTQLLAQKMVTDKSLLGTSSAIVDGRINGKKVEITTFADGRTNAVAVAGALSKAKNENNEPEGFLDKVNGFFEKTKDKVTTPINNTLDKLDDYVAGKISDKTGYNLQKAVNAADKAQKDIEAVENTITGADEKSAKEESNVSGAGSVAITLLKGQTSTIVDDAKINLTSPTSVPIATTSSTTPPHPTPVLTSLTTKATDEVFIGSWSGAAAISWGKGTQDNSIGGGSAQSDSSSVSVSGALAFNKLTRDVASITRNSKIENASKIDNSANKTGATVSAALGLALSKGAKSTAVSAGVSYNSSSSDIHALMINNKVSSNTKMIGSEEPNKTTIQNTSYAGDIQVTGGINASVAIGDKKSTAAGASIVIGRLNNNIESSLYDGSYENIKDINTTAVIATKQVGAGLGISVAVGGQGAQGGQGSSGAFQGVGVYNEVNNISNATVDGVTITGDSATKLTVEAYDTNFDHAKHINYIKDRGVDADGSSYTKASVNHTNDSEDNQNYNKALNNKVKTGKGSGNTIVTGAISVAGTSGENAVGASVVVDRITNNIHSNIINSNITAGKIINSANNDTLLIGAAAGAAGSKKFAGAGSVSWQEIENSAIATTNNSTIKTNNIALDASNSMLGVNVAGQISAGKKAVGLALAYSNLDNKTGSYIKGSQIDTIDAAGSEVTLNSASSAKMFTVGVGVSPSLADLAINGTVAINRGANTTEAIVDSYKTPTNTKRSTLNNANTIILNANDQTTTTAIAGGISAGGGNAIGGAVAINDIGGFSPDSIKSTQNIIAKIKDTDIHNYKTDSEVTTNANDDAQMITVAVGIGASSKVAVQGSAATSLINKKVLSALENTNINNSGDTSNINGLKLKSLATNKSNIVANATVVAASGDAAIGAGVGVNRIVQTTQASIDGGSQVLGNTLLKAKSDPTITATGFGGAGAGKLSISGSIGINKITNNTIATIRKAVTTSFSDNVGVIAQSDEIIGNYAGAISGSGTAAIGASVALNEILGNTTATIEDSVINVAGSANNKIETAGAMNQDAIIHSALYETSFKSSSLKNGRIKTQHKGLVVDSSATHTISSVMATGGGSGKVAAMGTVNVNTIGGSTTAQILNTDVNKHKSENELALSNVSVNAADYTNSGGFTATLAGSGNVSIGAAADTNLVNRATIAKISGNNSNDTQKNYLKANNIYVNAISQQGLSNLDGSATVAIEGVALGGAVSVDKLTSTTNATVENMDINFIGDTSITAEHNDSINIANTTIAGTAIGAALGLSVGVVDQQSVVSTLVKDSNIKSIATNSSTSAIVKAKNTSTLNTLVTAGAGSVIGASGAGNTAINNMKQNVSTTIDDSDIEAGSVDILAHDTSNISANGGALSAGGGALGVSVSVNTFDNTVKTIVKKR